MATDETPMKVQDMNMADLAATKEYLVRRIRDLNETLKNPCTSLYHGENYRSSQSLAWSEHALLCVNQRMRFLVESLDLSITSEENILVD